MKSSVIFLSALLPFTAGYDALACGDSLYRVGTGVSYREYTAPLPGNVLIYGQSAGADELADALTRSGHRVRQVANELALAVELKTNQYDVIIASYRDHITVDDQSAASNARFLPVAQNTDEQSLAVDRYGNALLADRDELKHYLKAIHQALKSKAVKT